MILGHTIEVRGQLSRSVVEAPGDPQLEHPRILRVVENREVVPVPEHVLVEMLHLDQYPHAFPLGRGKHVDHRIVSQFLLALVVELRRRRIIPEGIVRRVVAAVQPELEPQHVLHDVELEVITEIRTDRRHRHNLLG